MKLNLLSKAESTLAPEMELNLPPEGAGGFGLLQSSACLYAAACVQQNFLPCDVDTLVDYVGMSVPFVQTVVNMLDP